MATSNCSRCQLLESLDQLDTEGLIAEQLALEIGNIVNKKIRNQRLAICEQCPLLLNGVCQRCGCYTEFRASLKNKSCPDQRW